jgi:transcriptional regulator with XRE-family HTH domain
MHDDPPGPDSTLGERLEWGRTLKQMTKGELAQAAGTKPQRYSEWTRLEKPVTPSVENLRRLADALELDSYWLQTGFGNPRFGPFPLPKHAVPIEQRLTQLETLVMKLFRVLSESGAIPDDAQADLFRSAVTVVSSVSEERLSEQLEQELEREAERVEGQRNAGAEVTPQQPRKGRA